MRLVALSPLLYAASVYSVRVQHRKHPSLADAAAKKDSEAVPPLGETSPGQESASSTTPRVVDALSSGAWVLVQANAFCSEELRKDLVRGLSIFECQALVERDGDCGDQLYGTIDVCRCVRKGMVCDFRPSHLGNNVYEKHTSSSPTQAAAEPAEPAEPAAEPADLKAEPAAEPAEVSPAAEPVAPPSLPQPDDQAPKTILNSELSPAAEPVAPPLVPPPDTLKIARMKRELLSGPAKECTDSWPVQVFSDVDDTFKASGGRYPFGCDDLYTHGVIYPGMAQFLLELSRGPEEKTRVLNPTVLSARPAEVRSLIGIGKGGVEDMAMSSRPMPKSTRAFTDTQNIMPLQDVENVEGYNYQDICEGGLLDYACKPLMRGSVHEKAFGLNIYGSFYGTASDGPIYNRMGETKFERIKSFFAKIEDTRTCGVFVGDDGQGDCNPGVSKMRNWSTGGMLGLKAAFIHRLPCSPKDAHHRKCTSVSKKPGTAPVFLFDTYLDAAMIAMLNKLISSKGFKRVARAVSSFFHYNCYPDASKTRAPETITTAGCAQLLQSFNKIGGPRFDKIIKSRAMFRVEAFCETCCYREASTSETQFRLYDEQFCCANIHELVDSTRGKLRRGFMNLLGHLPPVTAKAVQCEARCKDLRPVGR